MNFIIQFLESEREGLVKDIALQGVGEGKTDNRPVRIEKFKKAIKILKEKTEEPSDVSNVEELIDEIKNKIEVEIAEVLDKQLEPLYHLF